MNPKSAKRAQPVPNTGSPMADALRDLHAQHQAVHRAQAQAADQATKTARATQRRQAAQASNPVRALNSGPAPRDPLATIEQPVNAPLPKPMAQALADWRAKQPAPATPAANQQTGGQAKRQAKGRAPAQATNPTAEPNTPFAELMRQQARGPQPAALREKLALGATGDASADLPLATSHNTSSISPTGNKNVRQALHTDPHSQTTNRVRDAYTAPPSQGKSPTQAQPQLGALGELKAIQASLREQQAQARKAQATQQAAQRQRNAARDAFQRAVGAVHALPDTGKVLHHQPRDPVPMQRLLDEQAVMRESLSDEFDAGTLLETDEKLSFLRPGVGLDVARKLRMGEWTIQGQVDLHGLRIDAAREALGAFVRESHQKGLRCVRVIHGKGLGSPGKTPVLKSRVLRWLVQKAEVMAYVQANPNQGGDGAIVVLLRTSRR